MYMHVGSTVHKHTHSCKCFRNFLRQCRYGYNGFVGGGEMKTCCLERYYFCIRNKCIAEVLAVFCS